MSIFGFIFLRLKRFEDVVKEDIGVKKWVLCGIEMCIVLLVKDLVYRCFGRSFFVK